MLLTILNVLVLNQVMGWSGTDVTYFSEPEKFVKFVKSYSAKEPFLYTSYDQGSKKFKISHKFPKCYEEKYQSGFLCKEFVSRSFNSVQERIQRTGIDLNDELRKIQIHSDPRVLEIGIGVGRVLTELSYKYPKISFDGINKTKGEYELTDKSDLIKLANFFELSPKPKIKDLNKTNIFFKDLSEGRMKFLKSNSYDIVFSINTIRYLKRKDVLLEEVWRILKPNGVAVLDITLLDIIDKNKKVLSFGAEIVEKYLTDYKATFDPFTNILIFHKTKKDIDFRLKFIPEVSFHEDWDKLKKNYVTVGWNTFFSVNHD